MDFDIGSRGFRLKVLAGCIFILVFVSASVLGLGIGVPDNSVVSIEKDTRASNLGTSYVFNVNLQNGSKVTYEKYESHHPLCPEQPEKCGEDSRDHGWYAVQKTVEGTNFREVEEGLFKPANEVCMKSKTSFEAC